MAFISAYCWLLIETSLQKVSKDMRMPNGKNLKIHSVANTKKQWLLSGRHLTITEKEY